MARTDKRTPLAVNRGDLAAALGLPRDAAETDIQAAVAAKSDTQTPFAVDPVASAPEPNPVAPTDYPAHWATPRNAHDTDTSGTNNGAGTDYPAHWNR